MVYLLFRPTVRLSWWKGVHLQFSSSFTPLSLSLSLHHTHTPLLSPFTLPPPSPPLLISLSSLSLSLLHFFTIPSRLPTTLGCFARSTVWVIVCTQIHGSLATLAELGQRTARAHWLSVSAAGVNYSPQRFSGPCWRYWNLRACNDRAPDDGAEMLLALFSGALLLPLLHSPQSRLRRVSIGRLSVGGRGKATRGHFHSRDNGAFNSQQYQRVPCPLFLL